MASPDHTARARLFLIRNGTDTKRFDGKLYPLSIEQATRQTYASKLAGVALAVLTVEGVLLGHSTFRQEHDFDTRCGLLPLNPVQVNGLHAAIHFLHQYVDTLNSETSR